MAKPKFVNLNYNSKSPKLAAGLPQGSYVNEWEVTFKTRPTKARIASVLNKLLKAIFEHDYDDFNTVTIEYEWSRWVNVPFKYSLHIYRTAVEMKPAEKAAIAILRKKRIAKFMKSNNTANITGAVDDAAGTPTQPVGPRLPTPGALALGGPLTTGPHLPTPQALAQSGGPQTSGPQIPPPPGTLAVDRKDLEPVTDPPTL